MKNIVYYIPAAFCACLSFIAIGMQLKLGSDSFAWKPAFYCFLPVCFVMVGGLTAAMQKELQELRRRLAALEEKKSAA